MTDRIPVKDYKDVYCPLPFNHMNMHPNGNVSLCCVAEMFPPNDGFYRGQTSRHMMNLKNHTVKELWEKSTVTEVREQMLQGQKPKACEGCYKIEDNGGVSRRMTEGERWGRGLLEPKLEFIDLRMSKLCNYYPSLYTPVEPVISIDIIIE